MTRPVRTRRLRTTRRAAVLAVAASGLLTACSGGAESAMSGYDGEIGSLDLSGDCPEKIVVQTDWNPEAEHGSVYQLIGPGANVDAGSKRTSGPLFAGGEYTGVDIEVRSGGPAIGFQTVISQMYQDPEIMLGFIDTDQAIQAADSNPTTSVLAPLEVSPMMIMWDPETYPEVESIADLKDTDAKVLYFEGSAYMDYLTGADILSPDQVDGSYDGTPANFVTAGGANAQQGFASSEPYVYEHEVEGWMKPVGLQLVHDAGFPTYKSAIGLRSDDVDTHSACLSKLVPAIQQSMNDYYADPTATNDLMIDAIEKYDTGWVYGHPNAEYGAATMKELGLVGNGDNATMGDFDLDRVQHLLDITTPIFAEQGITIPADLAPETLVTNEFVDPSIGFTG